MKADRVVSLIPFTAVNLLGIFAFAAPFIFALPMSEETQARATDAPLVMALLVPLLLAVAIADTLSESRDSRRVALLGVLAACAAVLRLPISFAGANLFFILPIVCGFVFGLRMGFLLGALGMAASAFITGGIGPWLPFQMFAAGWIGGGAGIFRALSQEGRPRWVAAITLGSYGFVAAFLYGLLINLYFWPVAFSGDSVIGWQPGIGLAETVRHYISFYTITSAGWDAVGALFNLLILAALGSPLTELLSRFRRRMVPGIAIVTMTERPLVSSGG